MKSKLPTEELHYDMSQFYPLKATLEELLGHRVYLRLKETATLREWTQEIQKLLRAIKIAVKSTIEVADDDWFSDIDKILELGNKLVADSKTVTSLFADLSAILTRLVFLQIGFLPLGRYKQDVIPLRKEWWTLNIVRTVQYVQNDAQRHNAQLLREKRSNAIADVNNRETPSANK
jgi:hypothetical protein